MNLKRLHYGWKMVMMAACIISIHAFVFYGFGIFLKPLAEEFNWERGALSGAFSMAILLIGLFSILSGRLSDKYGPRILVTISGVSLGAGFLLMSRVNSLWQVYLVWGIFMGVGISFSFTPIISTIPRWFTKKRGLAVGGTVAGFGLGGVYTPPLTQWLISTYDWRQAYLILGLVAFIVVIPLAQFMRRGPQLMGIKPYGEEKALKNESSLVAEGLSVRRAIKSRRFWIWGITLFCFFFCVQVTTVHIVSYAIDIGISPIIAASITSVVAGCSSIGQLSTGFISDKIGGRSLLIVCVSLAALALVWLLFAKEVWMLYIFAVVFGVAYGGVILLQTVISAELFGLSSLGAILATLMMFGTSGGALGAPLAGSIFDITGSYSLAFLIAVLVCSLAIILSFVVSRTKDWRSNG